MEDPQDRGAPPGAGRTGLGQRAAEAAPAVVCLLSVVLTVLGGLLFLDNRGVGGTNRFFDPVMPVAAVAFPAAGAFVAARRPDVRVAWVMCGGALLAVAFFAEQYGVQALQVRAGQLPGGAAMAWLGRWLWVPGYLLVWTLLPLLFPDGRLPSARWRPLLWTVVALIAVATGLAGLDPGDPGGARGPAGLAGAVHAAGVFVLAPACWAALLVRYRRAGAEERRQLAWPLRAMALAVAVPLSVVLAGVLLGAWVPLGVYQVAAALALASVPAAIVFAVVHHRLYRLNVKADTVVDRLVVHAGLTVVGTVVFVALLGVLEAVVADDHPFALGLVSAVAAVAAVLALRARSERAVDRLLYRRRRYDYRVLGSLGRSLRSTLGADVLLPTVVEAVAAGLKLPYVAVTVGQGGEETVASAAHGEAGDGLLVLPLVHQNERVGASPSHPAAPGSRSTPPTGACWPTWPGRSRWWRTPSA